MSQNRIAYLLACVLMSPSAVAAASADPATSPIASPLAPCFVPNLQNDLAPERGDEFLRALDAMTLSTGQRTAIETLSATYCGEIAAQPAADALRSDEIAFHDGIKELLVPAQRAELDDRIAQLRTEERVIGRLQEAGADS